MRMRGVDTLELPAGRAVELKPGGYHVMLMDLKAPLKKGDTVPIKLKVRSKSGQTQDVEVKAEVRDVAAAGGPSKH
jgi:copper(I)-binding protein